MIQINNLRQVDLFSVLNKKQTCFELDKNKCELEIALDWSVNELSSNFYDSSHAISSNLSLPPIAVWQADKKSGGSSTVFFDTPAFTNSCNCFCFDKTLLIYKLCLYNFKVTSGEICSNHLYLNQMSHNLTNLNQCLTSLFQSQIAMH